MANYDWDSHNRQVVLDGRAVLERTSASLARSNQIAIESEETGTSVLSELNEQRETLLRAQSRLETANDGLSRSNKLLNGMRRNVLYNKLALIGIILMEIFILAGMLYLKFFHKK